MPFLNLVHLREMRCSICNNVLASAGSRSFVVDDHRDPVWFAEDQEPVEMIVEITCPNGHSTNIAVPNELAAEPALQTPDDAPIALDALLLTAPT
ncbi:MAG: hypothetical protein M3Y21_11245 [Candidatus Eremiobacteraeota bacterium]|nr:hypothetical protein [Candidatus Eremiobacteraeota bacterium]